MLIEKARTAEIDQYTEYLRFAIDLTRECGEQAVNRRRTARIVGQEQGIVTDSDLANTRVVVQRISERFPGHSIYTEELNKQTKLKPLGETGTMTWVVDDIDGTRNYSRGIGNEVTDSSDWSVSVGLQDERGEPIVGAVYAPDQHVTYYASKGNGAYIEKDGKIRKLHVSGDESRERFLLSVDAGIDLAVAHAIVQDVHSSGFVKKVKLRSLESSAIELGRVASGTFDGFLHTATLPHDVTAGLVIAHEAGAAVSWLNEKTLVVSNGQIHQTLVDATRRTITQMDPSSGK